MLKIVDVGQLQAAGMPARAAFERRPCPASISHRQDLIRPSADLSQQTIASSALCLALCLPTRLYPARSVACEASNPSSPGAAWLSAENLCLWFALGQPLMPFLRPSRLAKLARPVRFTCRCNATRSAQATVSSSSVPPAAAHETLGLVSRPGRLPPSPLLLRQATGEADSASRPDVGEDAPPTIADVALGSRLSEVLQQGRAVGIEDEGRLRELWSDPWSPYACLTSKSRSPSD